MPEINFVALGMRFRGDYVFKLTDNIKLEKDPLNEYDSNAIKIIVDNKHVAFVKKEDTSKFSMYDFVNPLSVISVFNNTNKTATYLTVKY